MLLQVVLGRVAGLSRNFFKGEVESVKEVNMWSLFVLVGLDDDQWLESESIELQVEISLIYRS